MIFLKSTEVSLYFLIENNFFHDPHNFFPIFELLFRLCVRSLFSSLLIKKSVYIYLAAS